MQRRPLEMLEFSTRDPATPDGLFFERLDAFMVKCLADIKAFADRECRPFEETRQYVAEWHSKYLFNPPIPTQPTASATTSSKGPVFHVGMSSLPYCVMTSAIGAIRCFTSFRVFV